MADATLVSGGPPPPLPETADYDYGLSIPPLDTSFFSQQLTGNDGDQSDYQNGVVFDDIDFSFDDLCLPSSDELEDLLNIPTQLQEPDSDHGHGTNSNYPNLVPNSGEFDVVFDSMSFELCNILGEEGDFSGDHSSSGFTVPNSAEKEFESHKNSDYLNTPSPESNGSNQGTPENCGGDAKKLNCASPESQASGNCSFDVSENSNNCAVKSVGDSPNPSNCSGTRGFHNQNTKLEDPVKKNTRSSLLKRKKDGDELLNNNIKSMTNKCRKSSCNADNSNSIGELREEDERRKARLIRNRESAQLSRQRKKHYVEELEDKVKTMHSTIQELNAKFSFFMAENAILRQQMGGGAAQPPAMAPALPGMYPPAAMMYPWMPYAPPYMVKPQGSQVPLIPIPRLPKQPTQAPKVNKNVDSKKKERVKTKKVAGVSFLGVLFFIMFFGGLVPMVNVRYGGVREALMGEETYVGGVSYEKHRGRVLMLNGTDYGGRNDVIGNSSLHCGHDEIVQLRNGSEPLVASLYVPRNDKLFKIDGNLIINSVLASEKAMSSHGKGSEETGLVPVHMQPHLRVGSADKDGRLQQWFREGLAGPMLSSGMCTEVFQFDISSAATPGPVFPATTSRNISKNQTKNSTHLTKRRNRRILHNISIPLPDSIHNISRNKENLKGNNTIPPMVVSVLVDPRETGDTDVDGVIGKKSLSRIFVVVLIDSVKYVTYSCVLPFLGSAPHLTT